MDVVWLLVEEVQLVVRGKAGDIDEDYRLEKKRKKTSQWCGCSREEVERMRCMTIGGGDWRW
jgi:hypothetical protein